MAKKDEDKQDNKKKGGKRDEKRGKRAAKPGKGGDDSYSSIATHPRARASVRRIKAWVGLAGFAIAALLSAEASVPFVQVGERALMAGVGGYLLAWWISMLVWRQLIMAEQRAAIEEIKRRRAENADAALPAERS